MYNCTLCGPELLNCKKGSRPETSCLYSGFRRSLIEMDEIGKLELRVSLGLATCARSCVSNDLRISSILVWADRERS